METEQLKTYLKALNLVGQHLNKDLIIAELSVFSAIMLSDGVIFRRIIESAKSRKKILNSFFSLEYLLGN